MPVYLPIFFKFAWLHRHVTANGRCLENALKEESSDSQPEDSVNRENNQVVSADDHPMLDPKANTLSDRRKALFEPLEPTMGGLKGGRNPAEILLPPPDFDTTSYPKGWLVGKKRKLVNVDVVESMRRIAIQEMNRKDREINGLNEQLEEDSRCLEHLQVQLLQERSRRAEVERENAMLQDQISMLMNMMEESQEVDEVEEPPADS
ncbi:protein HEADING DATE REPRESSOR 1 isoform X2 [Typha latifolia]|uniref:protein HEADING DATE REPRESSOR 1 isoform X2 n=1 Tax=Typha latifolia TaxID=4733 RepID=UPI003C2D3907